MTTDMTNATTTVSIKERMNFPTEPKADANFSFVVGSSTGSESYIVWTDKIELLHTVYSKDMVLSIILYHS